MPSIDLAALTMHVHAIIADPRNDAPSTGDMMLDKALADFARHRRSTRDSLTQDSFEVQAPFWLTPVPAHAPCQ